MTTVAPMSARLASAPVTWGVWERTIDRSDLIPPDRMLETVSALGYTGIELGPPGYFGADGPAVGASLAPYGLELVGGFAPLHFADEAAYGADLPVWLDPIVDVLLATGARGPVVLADAETPDRIASAGQPAEQARTALSADALARAIDRINRAVARCRERGVDAVFHHHAATYFETVVEIEALLAGSDVGVCFDTGHAAVGGADPGELVALFGDRIEHVHLKDVDGELLEQVRRGELGLEQAWDDGLFCPFGEGIVDFRAVMALPQLEAFAGWLVLEQDRVAVSVGDLEQVRAVEQGNLDAVAHARGIATNT
jgi:inosose dehydratase